MVRTCLLEPGKLQTYIYGYVDPVATMRAQWKSLDSYGKGRSPNFESAPSKKKSRSVKTAAAVAAPPAARNAAVRRITTAFLSCSKMVYWITGLMTSTSAGPMPRMKPRGPSVARMCRIVWRIDSFWIGWGAGVEEDGSVCFGILCTA